jgi:predicted DNA-binding transcriptional regulator YafY
MVDLGVLQGAIEQHLLVSFDYVNRMGEATHRDGMEVYEIKNGFLYAFCPVHQEIHSFKLGSMANLFVTDQVFVPRW